MPRVILSTIGASLLTQQIKREDPAEKTHPPFSPLNKYD
jgi:hypothetical protein